MKNQLCLDYTAVLEKNIGSGGIKEDELNSLKPRLDKIHSQITSDISKNKPGFYFLPDNHDQVKKIKNYADGLSDKIENIIICGIGGSSLGPKAVYRALCHPFHHILSSNKRVGRRLFFMENVDPCTIKKLLEAIEPDKTLVTVISKSGSTAETAAQQLIINKWLVDNLGKNASKHTVYITDPQKGALRKLSKELDVVTLEIPPEVGGRFSVMTPVGLLPCYLAGVNIDEFLDGALAMRQRSQESDLFKNPSYMFAAVSYLLSELHHKNQLVMMPYVDQLYDTADWFRQLWAESLGKKYSLSGEIVHKGQTPIKALGTTDQHSQLQLYIEGPNDKFITFLTLDKRDDVEIPSNYSHIEEFTYLGGHTLEKLIETERQATICSLAAQGRPSITISLPELSAYHLGELLFLMEMSTMVAGALLNIDPFDQPGVEQGKKYTYGILGRKGYEKFNEEFNLLKPKISGKNII